MKINNKTLIFSIIGSILFMIQPIIFPTHPPEEADFIFSKSTQRDFIANILLLLFFYANYYLFIPKLYFKKKYIIFASCLIAGFLIITFLPSLVTGRNFLQGPPDFLHRPPGSMPPPRSFQKMEPNFHPDSSFLGYYIEINHHIFLFMAAVSFSLLLKIRNRWFETEKAKKDAEISYLMAQINPHFLFNALNSIYSLSIKEKAGQSSEAILKLSGMMRYIVTETSSEFVPIEKELAYIEDFIELHKLRLDKSIKLKYERSGNFAGSKIAPLLLIPFIENAFKHGVNPDEDSEIQILINGQPGFIQLRVDNNKVTTRFATHEKSGIGIDNTVNRLNLIYPSKHQLTISDTKDFYNVNLTILLS